MSQRNYTLEGDLIRMTWRDQLLEIRPSPALKAHLVPGCTCRIIPVPTGSGTGFEPTVFLGGVDDCPVHGLGVTLSQPG